MSIVKDRLKIIHFVLFLSFINFLFFHYPFFSFVFKNVDYKSINGVILTGSLIVAALVANAFAFYLFCSLFRVVGKVLLSILFIINSVAVYFVNTYSIILDESMIGNVLNTKYEEAASFFSVKLLVYLIFLGIIPSLYITKIKIIYSAWKKFLVNTSLMLVFLLALIFANASNWLWVDKNAKELIGLAMPWSYVVNTMRFYIHEHDKNKKEILLPDATIKDSQKSIVVLVIGESARSQNFSLYGYKRNTNPFLSKIHNVFHFNATSAATYTTAGVKSILAHSGSDELYEILPNYLYRNNVEVIWRTTNWGEPPVHIKDYQDRNVLMSKCKGEGCGYDEILLYGLREQIEASRNNKILVVLHTSTSHGPTYSKKYPRQFETFKPVCNSVELGECSHDELINAYDNTIVYTDYVLSRVIEELKRFKDYNSTMIFVSDHGESLGEKNLYMHGLPLSIAPKEQYEIPFIVWLPDGSRQLKPNKMLSQNHVFHSVLSFLNIQSPIYDEKMNIFSR
ncbi:Phosphoethanolamine transferase EptA [Dyadobacter sp. CECT 9275]|uniref:Phosphoethanolamine transferase EptA n=1 Tax=Dyadobacter helix TaxID=2822344 RepID=A0A916JDG2_9BACT|nr:phosphoethanolamine--lipid A transferase EptA [Dyadobacter sp. CECT 9275]CAG5003292.1 Phosphoethanolamine transferase EptA [Dyadobacter sp. CECT 9275]